MIDFPLLDLPACPLKIAYQAGKPYVFDVIRKKYVALTPEEWVRQHFIGFLALRGYPPSLMSVESGLKYNKLAKRSDILVYNRQGVPLLLVECKSYEVRLSDETFRQAAQYNQVLKAPLLAITNGLTHYFCRIDFEASSYEFLKDLPLY